MNIMNLINAATATKCLFFSLVPVVLVLSMIPCSLAYPSYRKAFESCVHCPEYTQLSAAEKEAIIYERIATTEYSEEDLPPFLTTCEAGDLMAGLDFNNQFDRFSDERPADFPRIFHSSGVVAKVKFNATEGHDFTGIFKGADHGVLRFSPLAPLMQEGFLVNYIMGTFLYSFALKFFRNGMHSANILTGDSSKEFKAYQNSRNFWTKPNFNIWSRPVNNFAGIGQLGPIFGEFEHVSGVISVADAAAYDQDGMEEPESKSPVIVHFLPDEDIAAKFGRVEKIDFRTWTATEEAVPTGTVLYTAWTTVNRETGEPALCMDPDGIPQMDEEVSTYCPEQEVIKLGDVITTSRFYASQWPDDWLFFQHTRVCPKDQQNCVVDDDASNAANQMESVFENLPKPDPTFAGSAENLCMSIDEDTGGVLTGNLPTCPVGSSPESDYCYPGVYRKVEETQVAQCPLMNGLSDEIIGTGGSANPSQGCSFLSRISLSFLEGVLWATSTVLRRLERLLGRN